MDNIRADHLPSRTPIRYWIGKPGARTLKDFTIEECVKRLTSAYLAESAQKLYYTDETVYPWWMGFGFF
jgi:hypothetical protein